MEKIQHSTIKTNGINMHIASIGTGPPVLLLHGFPELWYSWRHQLLSLSSLGYRAIAPDLRGFGDSDAPPSPASYTAPFIVGDLVGLLDHLGIDQVFLVGHDWGAAVAWYFSLFRPDRVKAVINLSVPYLPRNPAGKFVEGFRALFGDDYYFCRFQESGEAEKDFASQDTKILFKKFLTSFGPVPLCISKELGFRGLKAPDALPSWLSEDDIDYYATKFDKTGFTGGLNYYRSFDLTWDLTAAWTGAQIKVPAKFIVGDQDIVYNIPGIKEYIHNGGFNRDVPFLQEVVVMEGVAHFINQEKPDEVTTHIYDFIKKF
ncbi:uncharacterized protein LOC107405967 [Ziziphus jujuba]|uniref:Uncharacterized protein LOC107405967 n=1 Tax=Ziziphus jujuba TaxID=326968 RepID=A0A9B4ALT2_ZIZJJ|nr:uncharacterized protein LOC107405967 [Ziziphus jujuba]